jgi:long-chain acyl-CoA synthetase
LITGLDALGVHRGEVIGILSNTHWEWMAADWAIIGLGAVSTTLYPSQVPSNLAFIVNDSGARYVFVEDRTQYAKLASIREQIPSVRKLILFDSAEELDGDPWVISFEHLRQMGHRTPEAADALAAERVAAIRPDDCAAIIYTSGTTGEPKGAVHTHATPMAQIACCTAMLSTVRSGMVDVLWLPLAHVIARMEHLAGYERSILTVVSSSLRHFVRDVREVRPDLLFGALQVFKKVYATIMRKTVAGSLAGQWTFRWSQQVGRTICRLQQDHQPIPLALRLEYTLEDRLVFRNVREAFGSHFACAVSGAAPLAPEIIEFFHGAGVLLLEGWGLTEAGGELALNTVDRYRIGTVGQIYPGHEVRIAADGAILVRGPCICKGYHHNQEAAAEAFDADGWFHTGDMGSLDSEGFLRIVDRKKDLIITAGGEHIAPQFVEEKFRTISFVSQACVYGDGPPYLVALLTLDRDRVHAWANEQGVSYREVQDVYALPQFRAVLDEAVAHVNARLAAYEAVRNYDILPRDFTVDNELLTRVQKMRLQDIHQQYRA